MFARGTTRNAAVSGAVVLAIALGLSGCGGSGSTPEAEDAARTGATTEPDEPATGTDAETEPEPEPITAEEERWLRMVTRYGKRFEREYFRPGPVTHASMAREARLFRDCRATLRRAGDPGRLEPAAKRARRACERLGGAARLLDRAISVSDPGGTVIAGTEEARIFDRSTGRAREAAGNAHYGLQRAQELAEQIASNLRS